MLELAIFFLLKTFRSVALLFHRRVVATLTFSALQNNQFTGHNSTTFSFDQNCNKQFRMFDSYTIIIPNRLIQAVRDMSQSQVLT